MPELIPKHPGFLKKAEAVKGMVYRSNEEAEYFKEIIEKHNEKLIGSGLECIVVQRKGRGNEEKVVAFSYEDIPPQEAKEIFYLQRIYSTLFPHNFPHFYASFGGNAKTETVAGTIRHKIKGPHLGESGYGYSSLQDIEGKSAVKFPLDLIIETIHKLGLPLAFDSSNKNFILGADGGEYYVDTQHSNKIDLSNQHKVLEYMNKMKYSEEDKHMVRASMERLMQLRKEGDK